MQGPGEAAVLEQPLDWAQSVASPRGPQGFEEPLALGLVGSGLPALWCKRHRRQVLVSVGLERQEAP